MASEPSDFIYGINPVFETVRAGRRQISRGYLAEGSATNPRIRKLAEFLGKRGVPVTWASKGELTQLAGTGEHRGAVLEAGSYPYVPFSELIGLPRLVLLDNIEDPHNAGAVMRSAEVLGFGGVLLPRRRVPLVLPSVVRTSSGACEFLKIACNCSANQYIKIGKTEGYTIVSLDSKGQTSLEEIAAAKVEKLLLVVGGEDKGVGQFILNESDFVAAIPQVGRVNSLNASVAAGVALYMLRQGATPEPQA